MATDVVEVLNCLCVKVAGFNTTYESYRLLVQELGLNQHKLHWLRSQGHSCVVGDTVGMDSVAHSFGVEIMIRWSV